MKIYLVHTHKSSLIVTDFNLFVIFELSSLDRGAGDY